MAAFTISEDFLILCSRSEAIVVVKSVKDPEKLVLTLPPQCDDSKKKSKDDSNLENYSTILKISSSGKYLAICCGKKLCIWLTKDWSLLNTREVVRAASSLVFTPSEKNIVLADKSGDVYSFDVSSNEAGHIILGHLSVVLDVLVSSDEKYVISCDRDEKIRVSNWPNTYNIHSYCLGHKEFVSCIQFLPHDETIIVSGSGDGTLKLWRFLEGIEILSFNIKSLTVHTNDKELSAISQISLMKRNDLSSLVCLSIPQVPKIFVLIADSSNKITLSYHSYLDIASDPIHFCISDQCLWVLNNEVELMLFRWSEKDNKFDVNKTFTSNLLENLSIDCHKIFCIPKKHDSIDYLYKKKYDNVHDYLMKKKARTETAL